MQKWKDDQLNGNPSLSQKMKQNNVMSTENKILYSVSEWADYEGGGIIAIFSTAEKAIEYFDKLKPDCTTGNSVEEIKVDDPIFNGKEIKQKHG